MFLLYMVFQSSWAIMDYWNFTPSLYMVIVTANINLILSWSKTLQSIMFQLDLSTLYQTSHLSAQAATPDLADAGLYFMTDMIELTTRAQEPMATYEARVVQLLTAPHYGYVSLPASPALFGPQRLPVDWEILGTAAVTEPYRACTEVTNVKRLYHRIAVVQRSDCMFETKVCSS